MPVFDFTSPEGKKYRVNGPEGATKAQAFDVLQKQIEAGTAQEAQPIEQPKEPPGFPGAGIIEPTMTLLSGIPAESIAGLSALWPTLTGDPDKAVQNINTMREMLTYQPRTEKGQQGLQTAGEFMEPVGKGLQAVSDKFAESGAMNAEALGIDPAIGAGVGAAFPDLAMSLTGLKGGKAIAKSPQLKAVAGAAKSGIDDAIDTAKNAFTGQSKFKTKIMEQIEAGSTDKSLVKYMVDGAGKVKTDKVAQNAITQGFDKGVVAAIKGANSTEKAKLLKMVDVMEKGKNNALYGAKFRPSDVAGDSLLGRVKHIKAVNQKAGAQLDVVAKSLKGQKVDFTGAMDDFYKSLDDLGISFDKNLKPVFSGSDIEGLSGPEKAINSIVNRLKAGKFGDTPDAYSVHRMKKYIDEIVTYGKEGEGLKGKTERVLKRLRKNLDSTLDDNFPEYNTVNTTYADTVNAIDSLQDVAGKKMNLYGPNSDKAVGTLLRRMMSNAQSRVNLVDSIDTIEEVAKKYGGKFDDDIATQMLFVDELNSRFGTAAKTSFQGEVTKGVRNAAGGITGERSLTGLALDAGEAVYNKTRGINEENAFKAIREVLNKK